MRRFVLAAAVVLGVLAAGNAGAQTFFNLSGQLTSSHYDFNDGVLAPINSPFNAVVSISPSYASASFTSSVLVGVPSAPGVDYGTGPGSVTKVSDLEYLISVSGLTGDTPAGVYADLRLASPLPSTPGLLAVLPTSTIQLATRFHAYYGTITTATTAVPEAGTWAMMMVGLGMVGMALRRRSVSESDAKGKPMVTSLARVGRNM